ncbi:Uncharacterised protein [Moraxella lacunata]|uniref:Antitoxin VbhA domain-containing protein n=1 Tax=Moraxella lacunata TaxID=477 RepID=A0A1V4H022_MORLA|nr:antitoxin VbhA family protein [Moraxella lacunata]OPH37726.1 hypothetical protein B5J94_05045 [Moraxella lacunata]STZ74863.1 Uncharacterised protein [Moraxella lacunata]
MQQIQQPQTVSRNFFAKTTSSVKKPATPTITPQERQRRLTAWEKTLANFALEDIHPTEDMKRIGFMYINGEISFEQRSEMMKASILAGK